MPPQTSATGWRTSRSASSIAKATQSQTSHPEYRQTHAHPNLPSAPPLSTEAFRDSETSASDQAQYQKIAKQLFNASVPENALKWQSMAPEPGKVDYSEADRLIQWSDRARLSMRGHTLFWEVEEFNPTWVKALKPEALRKTMLDRTKNLCQRYRGKVDEIDLFNEMLHGNFFTSRLGPGIIKEVADTCKQANPQVKLYVNDYDILNGTRLEDYANQIQDLLNSGVPIEGIGIQAHIEKPLTTTEINTALDRLAPFNLPLKITEVSLKAPSDEAQAQWLTDLYTTAFAHKSVESILLWGYWEPRHWWPQAALYRKDWTPKPAAIAYQTLIHNQWWTHKTLTTDKAGQIQTPAFLGQYEISIREGNRHRTQPLILTKDNPIQTTIVLK
ncbi:MAG: 1,4-beta-xylanase [Alkalinema sp. RU_4_3]|nr:1,4-beta-xylanase [Alkalinema sp. RU_4_3]